MSADKPTYGDSAVYVVDGCRTPFLKAAGRPGPFTASDLAVYAGRNLLARLPFSASEFDQLILGCVMPGPDEVNIARVVALRLGFDEKIPAYTVQRNCASGLQSLDNAARDIASGNADLILAGGTESMSHAPLLFSQAMVTWLAGWNRARGLAARGKALLQFRLHYLAPIIGLLRGLSDPIVGMSMGQTAEKIAHRFGITREMMDRYAVRSHQRLARAQQEGWFDAEMEILYSADGRFFDHDDGVRPDTDIDKLARLKPVFDRHFGKVTAGNSAQITDGAALLVLASEDAVRRHKLPVLGRLIDSQWAGLDPSQMGLGPVHAVTPLLKRHRLGLHDIDLWEINEAFAAQVLACLAAWNDEEYCSRELGLDAAMGEIDQERLNIDGGGVSLGHPVGASGARIVLHLLHALQRCDKTRGMASLCIGGGQGGAMLVERAAAPQPKASARPTTDSQTTEHNHDDAE